MLICAKSYTPFLCEWNLEKSQPFLDFAARLDPSNQIYFLFFQTKDKDGLLSLKLADASSSRCRLPCPGSQHLVGQKGVTSFFVCVMSLFFFTVKEERRFSFIFGFIRPWNMNFQQQSADFLFGVVLSFCLFLLKTSSPGEQVPFRRHRTSKCRFADCRGC